MGENTFSVDIDAAVRRYADMVYRLAVANTNVTQDAEDVFQEVFVKLVRYKDKITDEEHLKAWLIRVTINEARRLEGSGWKKNVSVDMPDEMQDNISADQDEETSPEEIVIAEENRKSVVNMVQSLPQKYREVIHLHYFEEMKISEISNLLKINEATVKTRLKRARETLEKYMKGGI